MNHKTLIIGRGLAGAILSFRLHEAGISHDIIDSPFLSSSSKVAAGVVNPIVLKRLKLVQDAEHYLPEINSFYPHWEKHLKTQFYFPIKIKHILSDVAEENLWMEKSENPLYVPYLGSIIRKPHAHLKMKVGFGIVENTGWLHTEKFLDSHLQFHQEKGRYNEEEVDHKKLEQLQGEYEKVIICTGHLMKKLLPETEVAFAPTRGEVMTIKSSDLPGDAIYHGPVFILPLGNGFFKVGATYHWDNFTDTPTAEGLQKLKSALEKFFTGEYEVVEHQAGVRPNVKDRKPLLGKIKENLYSFNGMGSRAVLMAPYLSQTFGEHLFRGKPIPDKLNIDRYLVN